MFKIFYLNITEEDVQHEDFQEIFSEIFLTRTEFPLTCTILMKGHSFNDGFYKYAITNSLLNYQHFYGKHILKV